eukprot:569730-Rhodomonas_salina.2
MGLCRTGIAPGDAMCGAELASGRGTQVVTCASLKQVVLRVPMLLRLSYAMPGTDTGYAATRSARMWLSTSGRACSATRCVVLYGATRYAVRR